MYGEKAWRQLHKNTASNTEQVLEVTHPKQQPYAYLPLITKTIKVRQARYCWISKDELISDILRLTSSHGPAKAGRPAQTYIQLLCADTGCTLEDLPGAIDKRELRRSVLAARHYYYHYYYICSCCNGYRRMKWIQGYEFKSWTRQFGFEMVLIPMGMVWIQLFSFQLWANSRSDWLFKLGIETSLREEKPCIQTF